MTIEASVIIPARNASGTLGEQLDALAHQTWAGRFEVIVSDNGSTDATAAVARSWAERLPGLRVVDSSAAPGVSGARNIATAEAASDKVMYCDADDLCDAGWVEAMASALDKSDLVGGVLETARLNSSAVRGWGEPETAEGLPNALHHLPYAVGANFGVRRSVWHEMGGFDASFVGGHEEVDFCWRAQRAGHTITHAPTAVIHYRLRADLKGLFRQRRSSGRTNAELQRRYAADLSVDELTVARGVRILLSHLRDAAALAHPRRRGAWIGGLGWAIGRLEYALGSGAPLRGRRPARRE